MAVAFRITFSRRINQKCTPWINSIIQPFNSFFFYFDKIVFVGTRGMARGGESVLVYLSKKCYAGSVKCRMLFHIMRYSSSRHPSMVLSTMKMVVTIIINNISATLPNYSTLQVLYIFRSACNCKCKGWYLFMTCISVMAGE